MASRKSSWPAGITLLALPLTLAACSAGDPEPHRVSEAGEPASQGMNLADVDWSSVRVPDICGPKRSDLVRLSNYRGRAADHVMTLVMDQDSITLRPTEDGESSDIAVVGLHCEGGTSSPDKVVFFAPGEDEPEVIGYGLDGTTAYLDTAKWTDPETLRITGLGLSPDAAMCCPDLKVEQIWTYANGHLVLDREDSTPTEESNPTEGDLDQELADMAAEEATLADCHAPQDSAETIKSTWWEGHLRVRRDRDFSKAALLVQDWLNTVRRQCLPEDGLYGPSTARAVADFQRSYGLAGTGVVDEATFSQLQTVAILYYE